VAVVVVTTGVVSGEALSDPEQADSMAKALRIPALRAERERDIDPSGDVRHTRRHSATNVIARVLVDTHER
jgi:hypothetical protein